MIYKLFRNKNKEKLFLDMSYDRQDIIDALANYMSCFISIDYTIIENKDGKDIEIARIRSVEDYISFKYDIKKLERKK